MPPVRRSVGTITVTVISDGSLLVPLSMTLPDIPAADAAKPVRRARAAARRLASPDQRQPDRDAATNLILVDAGSGANFQPTAGKLAENMEAAGLDPAKVTKVVFTHGHADHLWGALDDFDDSERFANASYVISAAEWDFWIDPDTPSRVPDWLKGMARGSARILKRLEGKIERRKAAMRSHPVSAISKRPGIRRATCRSWWKTAMSGC